MASLATGIVLTAGFMTFGNEWYQTHHVNLRIPIATLIAGAVFDGLAHVDDKAAIGLSIMVLIGALTARFNGQSVADTVAEFFNNSSGVPAVKRRVKVA